MHLPTFRMPRPNGLVLIYLLAIVVANVLVARFGPGVSILNAVCFVGLDLSTRDHLHAQWGGRRLWPRMLMLIGAGGMLSLVLGGNGRIALASCIAFISASCVDTAAYLALARYGRRTRMNGSNMAAALVDSLLFPLLAFGWPVSWLIVLGHLVAKVAGGALWALLLTQFHIRARHAYGR